MDTTNIADELNKLFKGAPGADEVTATIKAVSPTKVINFLDINNQENPYSIIGSALLINGFKEYKDIKFDNKVYQVPSIADMDNIKNGSVIYIKDYQKLEALHIIDGALTLLYNNSVISETDASIIINEVIKLNNFNKLGKPYIDLRESTALLKSLSTSDQKTKALGNLLQIIKFIWFIPYGELDNIYNDFVSEFNDSNAKNN